MKTVWIILIALCSLPIFGQRTQHLPHHTPDTTVINPLDYNVPSTSTFKVQIDFAKGTALLQWDAIQENLTDSLRITVFDYNDWALVSEHQVSDPSSGSYRFATGAWQSGTYILQIDYWDGAPVMMLKFDWVPTSTDE